MTLNALPCLESNFWANALMPCKKLYIMVPVYFGIPNLLISANMVISTNQGIIEKLHKSVLNISVDHERKKI